MDYEEHSLREAKSLPFFLKRPTYRRLKIIEEKAEVKNNVDPLFLLYSSHKHFS
jgi:hypothetical protein